MIKLLAIPLALLSMTAHAELTAWNPALAGKQVAVLAATATRVGTQLGFQVQSFAARSMGTNLLGVPSSFNVMSAGELASTYRARLSGRTCQVAIRDDLGSRDTTWEAGMVVDAISRDCLAPTISSGITYAQQAAFGAAMRVQYLMSVGLDTDMLALLAVSADNHKDHKFAAAAFAARDGVSSNPCAIAAKHAKIPGTFPCAPFRVQAGTVAIYPTKNLPTRAESSSIIKASVKYVSLLKEMQVSVKDVVESRAWVVTTNGVEARTFDAAAEHGSAMLLDYGRACKVSINSDANEDFQEIADYMQVSFEQVMIRVVTHEIGHCADFAKYNPQRNPSESEELRMESFADVIASQKLRKLGAGDSVITRMAEYRDSLEEYTHGTAAALKEYASKAAQLDGENECLVADYITTKGHADFPSFKLANAKKWDDLCNKS